MTVGKQCREAQSPPVVDRRQLTLERHIRAKNSRAPPRPFGDPTANDDDDFAALGGFRWQNWTALVRYVAVGD